MSIRRAAGRFGILFEWMAVVLPKYLMIVVFLFEWKTSA